MFIASKSIKKHRFLGALILIIIIGFTVHFSRKESPSDSWTTTTVSRGTVRNIVSISGTVEAQNTADLAFPQGGILTSVAVKEGEMVVAGQVLASLNYADVSAEYNDALAALTIARANQDELINGLRPEEVQVTETTVAIAREELARITREQNERVENAYRTLLSSDLEALPLGSNEEDSFPTVSGTYLCDAGTYTLNVFRSGARSGYSYTLNGLETGTYSITTESPSPLGSCGLKIQFVDGKAYGNSEWKIQIPNKRSASYITNENAYRLALTQRENAIAAAQQELTLAEQNAILDTADPRTESLARAEAAVTQAEARLEKLQAQVNDHILIAPFDGMVTKIYPVVGESVGTDAVLTMVSNSAFELTALVPEIDITKISPNLKADTVFDARQDEIIPAHISFISPLAQEIDGVSYFEAKLIFDNEVPWLRSGLNADVDIILDERTNVLRVPKRYLIEKDGRTIVRIPNGEETVEQEVTALFSGNDGYVEITGLDEGATIVAP